MLWASSATWRQISGAPRPHDFAVRVRAARQVQRLHVHRIPASRVVTTAIRPSASEAGCAHITTTLYFEKQKYFSEPGLTRIREQLPVGQISSQGKFMND
jgi:hypothetical protein